MTSISLQMQIHDKVRSFKADQPFYTFYNKIKMERLGFIQQASDSEASIPARKLEFKEDKAHFRKFKKQFKT